MGFIKKKKSTKRNVFLRLDWRKKAIYFHNFGGYPKDYHLGKHEVKRVVGEDVSEHCKSTYFK